MSVLTKQQIIDTSLRLFKELQDECGQIPEEDFFEYPSNGKWSIAQNIRHLVISTNTTTMAYSLPKWILRWVGGRPNRAGKTYEELVAKYTSKLQQGGRARGRYVPKKIPAAYTKDKLLQDWNKAGERYLNKLQRNWTEDQLDHYLAPHPLLGKITMRELGYFTCYHIKHHLNSIRSAIA
jgi:DinB superfamily